jgi:hypothetical protein
MEVTDALTLMIGFGTLLIGLVSLIVKIVLALTDKKK